VAGEEPPVTKPTATETRSASAATTPSATTTVSIPVSTPVNVPVATPCPTPVRLVPVVVTRCVPTLVPVGYFTTHRGPCGCQTVAVTRYEWRNRLVTETRFGTACH